MNTEQYIAQETWDEIILNYLKLKTKQKMKITTTKIVQPANDVLGTTEKTLYYVVIESEKTGRKMTINVGEKTYNTVNDLHKGVVGDLLDDGKLNKSNKNK